MLWIEMYPAMDGQPVASASKMSTASVLVNPEPPTSSATQIPPIPSWAALRSTSTGKCLRWSQSTACGARCSSAKPRTVSTRARWSSVSSPASPLLAGLWVTVVIAVRPWSG
jgi:hypothetical protein